MTKKLINLAADEAVGTTIYEPHRFRDEKALWQVLIPTTVVAGTKVRFYGRAAPEAPWHLLLEQVENDMGANNTDMNSVDLFPEVSVEVDSYGLSTGTIEAWLVD